MLCGCAAGKVSLRLSPPGGGNHPLDSLCYFPAMLAGACRVIAKKVINSAS